MSNLVVVAIPEEQDRVWKISSEQVPHLTLLFLGDESEADTQQIMQFVEHAVTLSEHGQFYANVDYRGTLGPDEADVLFFRKNSWDLKWIKQFRSQLLQNQAIRTAYDSTAQYEEWTPHLTLGYPATPAMPMKEDDFPIYSVCFDRIAVWVGDFEGPEFRLEWPERQLEGDLAIAYSDAQKEALTHYSGIMSPDEAREVMLEHFGTKGMRWGFRNKDTAVTVNGKSKMVTAKKADKLDKKWEKNQFKLPKGIERHNAMAEHFNSRIGTLNDKYKNDDFSKENFDHPAAWSPKYKAYNKEVLALNEVSFRHAVETVHGASPSGKKKVVVVGDIHADTMHIEVKDVEKIAHASIADTSEIFLFRVTRDSKGLITEVEPMEDSMAQTTELGAKFIEHHGVKGMKWGVRTDKVVSGIKSGAKKFGRGVTAVVNASHDVQFENMAKDGRAALEIESKAHEAFHRTDLPKINAKPEYHAARKLTKRLRNPRDPVVKQYRQEVKSAYIKRLEDAANSMSNASGTRQYTIRERGWELPAQGGALPTSKHMWEVSSRKIVHDASEDKPFFVELTLDQDGFVTDLSLVPPTKKALAQSTELTVSDLGAQFIVEHFGIKGMHWGFRKNPPTPVPAKATSKVPHGSLRKTKIDVAGGENHPAHEDAIKVAVAQAKLKKSGAKALSNQELRDVANRVQLENQVSLLTSSKGKTFVSRQLENEGKNLLREGVRAGAKAAVNQGIKRFATAAI